MKKTIKLLLLSTVFIAFSAHAKDTIIPLEDNSKILGKWKLTAEAGARHKTKTPLNIYWDFKKDGSLNTWAKDTRNRTGEMSITVKYSIEDGNIRKQASPGREKYENCKVVELEKKSMILHCKYLYFFFER
ncbi:MAG: lipocalin family protein [Methylococcales bacterium]|nr:lipocalin family protein [Methylococcales bacterium]